ncbi:MAG TPA: hypothetical protein P5304_25270 [Phycisphaerae bacterium]|nr:hypothetical protein [Phycisphaerae bacterium]
MSSIYIPKGPWQNKLCHDGDYDAIIYEITHGSYRKSDDGYFQIVLWLVQPKRFVVTNIYITEDGTSTLQRIWHLCQACGTTYEDFSNRLSEFREKHIVVKLAGVNHGGHQYSDVDRFIQPSQPLPQASLNEFRELVWLLG